MKFTIDKEVTYIPRVFDNHRAPKEEQISVVIKVPTAAETSSITGLDSQNARDLIAGVARFVSSINNLEVNGVPIKTGRELAECEGMYALALNVGAHILGMLADIEKDPT